MLTEGPPPSSTCKEAYETLEDDDARALVAYALVHALAFTDTPTRPPRFAARAGAELPDGSPTSATPCWRRA